MKQAEASIRNWHKGAGRILLPVLAFALLAVQDAGARDNRREGRRGSPPMLGIREPPRTMAAVPIDRIIRDIEKRYKAQVVRVDQSESNGRRIYVLRLLSEDGRVWTVKVDAETGREV